MGFLLDKCAAKDPWQSDLPIELYPFDPVPDDYVDYQKLIRASLKDYRRHRSLINGQICKGYDKKQQSTDTWAEYEKMEKDRAAMAARYPVGRRVFTVYNNRPHIRFKKRTCFRR